METIDFNSNLFKGFEEKEEILLDTGVILAYLNKYDSWNETVTNLFNNHILDNDSSVFLFVNPCIINEVTFLSGKPVEQYLKNNRQIQISQQEQEYSKTNTLESLKILIDNEILLVLDGDKNSVIKQIDLSEKLGSADAVNAALVNEYGINFLTVDNKLVSNMVSCKDQLQDVKKVYYTTPEHINRHGNIN